MQRKLFLWASIIVQIAGLFLMIIGFWASNINKDPTYRKRIVPIYDSFISVSHSLQQGNPIKVSNAMFPIYLNILYFAKPELKNENISEINNMNCQSTGMSYDGMHNYCQISIILEDGTERQIQVQDLQKIADYNLLELPAFKIEKRAFNLGLILTIIGMTFSLMNVRKVNRRKRQ